MGLTEQLSQADLIRTMGFQEAYEYFLSEVTDADDGIRTLVRFGVDLRFDIYDYFEGNITIKQKTGVAIIRGRQVPLEQLHSEIEERKILLKRHLLESIKEEHIIKPRTQAAPLQTALLRRSATFKNDEGDEKV